MITKICVLGERVSGTCFAQSLVTSNTNLKPVLPYGHKHFFQDIDRLRKDDTSDTLFLFISRDVMEWLNSFKKNPFHTDKTIRNCKDMGTFLRTEWKCVYDNTSGTPESSKLYGREMMCERNPSDGQRFENVVQMRNAKMAHFLGLREVVEHFVHVRYEDVRDDPRNFIENLCSEFSILKTKTFCDVKTVRGKGRVAYKRTYYPEMAAEDAEFVVRNVNTDLESLLGYL